MLQHPRSNKRVPCQERETLSTLQQTFKIRVQASSSGKSQIFGGNDRKTLMNDGSNAGSLYEAAQRHLPNPVSCLVYPLYFHIFMASTLELNMLRIQCLQHFSCVRSSHAGGGRELGLYQLWPIVFPLAESTSRPDWNSPGPASSGSEQNLTDLTQLGCMAVISRWGAAGTAPV